MLLKLRDRLNESANPILIKELFQAIRSRVFIGVFTWLLITAFTIYCLVYRITESSIGERMFAWYLPFMLITAMFVIPMMTFNALYREIVNKTLELIQITRLTSRKLIRGMLFAAVIRLVLLFSFLGPFIIASYLFGGVDIIQVLSICILAFILALCVCAASLSIASMAVHTGMKVAVRALFFILLFLSAIFFVWTAGALFIEIMYSRGASSMPSAGALLLGILCWIVFFATLILYLTSSAVNNLAFPHDRSSARSKVMVILCILSLFVSLWASAMFFGSGSFEPLVMPFQIIACTILGLGSLVWITGAYRVPWRHEIRFKKRKGILSLLYWIFFRDGPVYSIFHLFLTSALIIGLLTLAQILSGSSKHGTLFLDDKTVVYPLTVTVTYVLYLSMLSGLLLRILPKRYQNPFTQRSLLILLLIVTSLITLLIVTLNRSVPSSNIFTATIPLLFLISLSKGPSAFETIASLSPIFLVGFFWHFQQYAILSTRKPKKGLPSRSDTT